MKAVIRPAQLDDVKGISRIKKVVWQDTYPALSAEVSRADIAARDFSAKEPKRRQLIVKENYRYLVAEADGQIVGYCMGKKGSDRGVIKLMHILPAYQGKGIGSRLMSALLDWFGDRPVELQVATANQPAIGFHEKFGFSKVGSGEPIAISNQTKIDTIKMIRSLNT